MPPRIVIDIAKIKAERKQRQLNLDVYKKRRLSLEKEERCRSLNENQLFKSFEKILDEPSIPVEEYRDPKGIQVLNVRLYQSIWNSTSAFKKTVHRKGQTNLKIGNILNYNDYSHLELEQLAINLFYLLSVNVGQTRECLKILIQWIDEWHPQFIHVCAVFENFGFPVSRLLKNYFVPNNYSQYIEELKVEYKSFQCAQRDNRSEFNGETFQCVLVYVKDVIPYLNQLELESLMLLLCQICFDVNVVRFFELFNELIHKCFDYSDTFDTDKLLYSLYTMNIKSHEQCFFVNKILFPCSSKKCTHILIQLSYLYMCNLLYNREYSVTNDLILDEASEETKMASSTKLSLRSNKRDKIEFVEPISSSHVRRLTRISTRESISSAQAENSLKNTRRSKRNRVNDSEKEKPEISKTTTRKELRSNGSMVVDLGKQISSDHSHRSTRKTLKRKLKTMNNNVSDNDIIYVEENKKKTEENITEITSICVDKTNISNRAKRSSVFKKETSPDLSENNLKTQLPNETFERKYEELITNKKNEDIKQDNTETTLICLDGTNISNREKRRSVFKKETSPDLSENNLKSQLSNIKDIITETTSISLDGINISNKAKRRNVFKKEMSPDLSENNLKTHFPNKSFETKCGELITNKKNENIKEDLTEITSICYDERIKECDTNLKSLASNNVELHLTNKSFDTKKNVRISKKRCVENEQSRLRVTRLETKQSRHDAIVKNDIEIEQEVFDEHIDENYVNIFVKHSKDIVTFKRIDSMLGSHVAQHMQTPLRIYRVVNFVHMIINVIGIDERNMKWCESIMSRLCVIQQEYYGLENIHQHLVNLYLQRYRTEWGTKVNRIRRNRVNVEEAN